MLRSRKDKSFDVSDLPVKTSLNICLSVWLKQQVGCQSEIHLYGH